MNNILSKIHSFDAAIKAGADALKEMYEGKNWYGEDVQATLIEKPARDVISPLMAQLNAQAKYVQGLAYIVQYYCSNLQQDDSKLLDYAAIIDGPSATMLYTAEHLNFTKRMGMSEAAWWKGGEGLFFNLYFDESYPCFDMGVARRPFDLSPVIITWIQARQKERFARWNEMYPALAEDRPNVEEELAAFMLGMEKIAEKDAQYKDAPQAAWTWLTAWIKEKVPGYANVETIPAKEIGLAIQNIGNEQTVRERFWTLINFFKEWFAAARLSNALLVDLLSEKRLPSITRLIAVYVLTETHGLNPKLIIMPEWVITMAYGSPLFKTSSSLQEVRDLLVHADAPMFLRR